MSILLIIEIFMKASLLVKFIMATLLVLSVVSWTLIINRCLRLFKISKNDRAFEEKFWAGESLAQLVSAANSLKEATGIPLIILEGVKAYNQVKKARNFAGNDAIDYIDKKLNSVIAKELDEQDFGLNALSTITGISPYVGLFGTVWGIIEVFTSLGTAEQVNIQVIAPGISEALVATAMGLFVAIPALVFYNIFNRKVHFNESLYFSFLDQFTTIVQDDVYGKMKNTPSAQTQSTDNAN